MGLSIGIVGLPNVGSPSLKLWMDGTYHYFFYIIRGNLDLCHYL